MSSTPRTDAELEKRGTVDEPECECAELAAWKESALAVERGWDAQRIAKLLGIELGKDIRPNIEPKIRELIQERDTLLDENVKANGLLDMQMTDKFKLGEERKAEWIRAENAESTVAKLVRESDVLRIELFNARRLLELNAKIEADFVGGSPEKMVAEICALTKQRDELGAKLESTRSECDRYGMTLDTIAEMAANHMAVLHGHKMDGPRNPTERLLLDISTAAMDALNDQSKPHPEVVRLTEENALLKANMTQGRYHQDEISYACGDEIGSLVRQKVLKRRAAIEKEIADSMRQAPVD